MKIVEPSFSFVGDIDGMEMLRKVERIGRMCYKSEDKITENSCIDFVKMLISRNHLAMIEHAGFSVHFVCDRGVSHEIVRHRVASFAQESTRYCNYSKEKFGNEITVVRPFFFGESTVAYYEWMDDMHAAEAKYFSLLSLGFSPEEARSVLPNSLKTEIVMTANLREWRHFFLLRADRHAHPQMRQIVEPLLKEAKKLIPVVFDDISQEA